MADTPVSASPQTPGGPPFAADKDLAGTSWPYAKLAFGPSGTQTEAADADGARLPVKTIGPTGTLNDAASSISTGGSSQLLLAAATRRLLWIWNPVDQTEPLYVNFTNSAAANNTSIGLEAGAILRMESPAFVSSEAVNVFAASSGHKIGCKWA